MPRSHVASAACAGSKAPDAPDSDQPGFLHHVIGMLTQSTAAPQDIGIKSGEGFVVPRAPRLFVAGQNGVAKAPFAARRDPRSSWRPLSVSTIVLSPDDGILRGPHENLVTCVCSHVK